MRRAAEAACLARGWLSVVGLSAVLAIAGGAEGGGGCPCRKDLLEFLAEHRLETDFRSSRGCWDSQRGGETGCDCEGLVPARSVEDVCLQAVGRGSHWCFPTLVELRAAERRALCRGDPMRERLLKEIRQTLNPEDCDRAVPAPLPVYGFGATFHYAVIQLKRALAASLAISFSGYYVYAPPACTEQDLSCTMQPASYTCAFYDTSDWPFERESALSRVQGAEAAWRDGFFECCSAKGIAHEALGCEALNQLHSAEIHAKCGEKHAASVPAPYESMGSFWFISALAGYLFSPLRDTESWRACVTLLEAIAAGAEGGKTIGVQIRRGDACHAAEGQHIPHNQRCIPTHEYVRQIKALGELYGARHVFLSTNGDDSVARELRVSLPGYTVTTQAIAHPSKFQCCPPGVLECTSAHHAQCTTTSQMVLSMAQSEAEPHPADASLGSPGRGREETGPAQIHDEVVADIVGLASCDFLVGTFTSQVSRVAMELSYHWRGYVIPFSSLDIPWCWLGFRRGNVTHVNGTVFDYGC